MEVVDQGLLGRFGRASERALAFRIHVLEGGEYLCSMKGG